MKFVVALALALALSFDAFAGTEEAVELLKSGDYPGARAAFEAEAPKGDARAMFWLGVMSEEGKGGPANFSRAATWYRMAADRDDAEAQYRLARLYETGRGVPQDFPAAARWYRRAAERDYAPAQTRLGMMLLEGYGIDPDPIEARSWLDRAAAAGDEEALVAVLDLDSAKREDELQGVVPGVLPPAEEEAQLAALSPDGFALRERILAALDAFAPEGGPTHYGKLDLREDGGRFLVRLDDIAIADFETGREAVIGTVRGVFTPVGEGQYRLTLTLPQLIAVNDATGRQVGHLTFGSQKFEAQWVTDLEAFTVLDVDVRDVSYAEEDGAPAVRIGRIAHRHDLKPNETGRFSGDASGAIEQVQAFDETGRNVMTLGRLTYRQEVRSLDPRFLGGLRASLGVFGGVYDEGTGRPMLAGLPGDVSDIAGALGGEVTLERLSLSGPEDGRSLRLGEMNARLTLEDLDRDLARIGFSYRHGGLALAAPGTSPDQVPTDALIEIGIERLPLDGVVDALVSAFVATGEEGVAPPGIEVVPPLLDSAGTELRVASLALRLPKADASLSGGVRADATNPSGFAGEFVMRAFGLPGLVASLARNVDSPEDQQTAGLIAMVNALGEDEVDASGRTVRSFRLVIGPDGRPMLNGKPLGDLFGAPPAMVE